MSKKILFMVSSTNVIGPKKRRTGNLLSEVAHPYEAVLEEREVMLTTPVAGLI